MSSDQKSMRKLSILLLLFLTLLMLAYFAPVTPVVHATNPPTGTTFDNIVIIAMENTPYSAVFGSGTNSTCPSATIPVPCNMLPYGSTITELNSYGASGRTISGCSAGCYVALTSGSSQGIQDHYCDTLSGCPSSPTWNVANIISRFTTASLTWQAYCESGGSGNPCPRYADHFPFVAYSNAFNSGNIFDSDSVSTTTFINAAKGPNPPNFLWYTPTDNNNMHDGTISAGAAYLKNFLIGSTGTILAPAAGSLLATPLFALGKRTMLVLWWDECASTNNKNGLCDSNNAAPILFYQPSGVKPTFKSTNTIYDSYSILRMIEDNWALTPLVTLNDGSAFGLKDLIAPPQIVSPDSFLGWGGIRLDEVTRSNTTNIASQVGLNNATCQNGCTPTNKASNAENIVYTMEQRGMNTIRVDFDPWCTDQIDQNYMSVYSQTNAQTIIIIAQHYNFWVIFDYHGYSDIFRNTSCWLSYWSTIVNNTGPLYSKIIWEPENQPEYLNCNNSPSSCPTLTTCNGQDMGGTGTDCITYLSNAYQQWITRARTILGDTHWIVVQNLCSHGCSLSANRDGNGIGALNAYPTVTDSASHIFESLHGYMNYTHYSQSQNGGWNGANANITALGYYRTVLGGISTYRWPALNTEGGADPLTCDPNISCPNGPTDVVMDGSAGYTTTSFKFIQTLTNLYYNGTIRVGFTWWPTGDWTSSASSSFGNPYGALICTTPTKGWGCVLKVPANGFSISAYKVDSVQYASAHSTCPPTSGCWLANSTITITTGYPDLFTIDFNTTATGMTCGLSLQHTVGPSTTIMWCYSFNLNVVYYATLNVIDPAFTHSILLSFHFTSSGGGGGGKPRDPTH